jgi:hypothetical protein
LEANACSDFVIDRRSKPDRDAHLDIAVPLPVSRFRPYHRAMTAIRNLVILTGAGISAESGIATFRGPGGLWEGHRVEETWPSAN